MKGLKAYQSTSLEADVNVASPYEITAMLFDALIKNMHLARHSNKAKEWERKSEAISKAQAIVVTLASTLNDTAAPELSDNLRRLYDYVNESLADYMLDGSDEKIESSLKVIGDIKSGWDAIGSNNG